MDLLFADRNPGSTLNHIAGQILRIRSQSDYKSGLILLGHFLNIFHQAGRPAQA
ncbi:hypothetical protein D3C76_1184610 [compost metagenome]